MKWHPLTLRGTEDVGASRRPVYGTGSISVAERQLPLWAVGYVQSYDRCSPDGDGKDSATPSLCQQVVRTYEFYSAGWARTPVEADEFTARWPVDLSVAAVSAGESISFAATTQASTP